MKPLKLFIQAFGPFNQSECLDFQSLGSAPLFLINGPTGSGKTSLLDAMCFALYGETTGSERTGVQMRSDKAEDGLLTQVMFEFALGEKRYRVTRAPDQSISKKRGDGVTLKKHDASLYELQVDGAVNDEQTDERLLASKPTAVTAEIQSLLGLDVKQFRQVIVLPQGKFRQLLMANSKDREQIFGQLFQTQIYQKLEASLSEKAAGLRRRKEQLNLAIETELKSLSLCTEQELAQKRLELTQSNAHAKAKCETQKQLLDALKAEFHQAEKIVNEFKELESATLQLTQLMAQQVEINQLIEQKSRAEQAGLLAPEHNALQEVAIKISALNEEIHRLKERKIEQQSVKEKAEQYYQQAKRNSLSLDKRKQTLVELKQMMPKLTQRDLLAKACQDRRELCEANQRQWDNLTLRLEKGTAAIEAQKHLIDEQIRREKELPTHHYHLEQLNKQAQYRVERKKLNQQNHALLEQKKYQLDAVNLSISSVEKARQQADEIEYIWFSSQAAMLAKTLKKEQACPVCGSIEHPNLAQFLGDEVTKEQVDKARTEQLNAQKAQESEKQVFHQIETQEKLLASQLDSLAQLVDIEGSDQDLNRKINELKILIADINQMDLVKLEQDLIKYQGVFDQLMLEKTALETSHTQAKASYQKSLMAYEHLSEDLKNLGGEHATIAELTQSISNKEEAIAELIKAEENAQRLLQYADERWVGLCATLEAQNKAIAQELEIKVQKETLWERSLKQSVFNSVTEFQLACLSKEELDVLSHKINTFETKKHELTGQIRFIEGKLVDNTLPDIEQHKASISVEQDKLNQLDNVWQHIKEQWLLLKSAEQRLAALHHKNETLEQEYAVIGTLSDVTNGKTGNRLSLHRFVLGVLLDDVLLQASERLKRMSSGRYFLHRKADKARGNLGSGLELLVEDAYSGKKRDVATLSGGESFLAALSLALGLSDVVQSYSGGVRLDTLFIDEGFGSLDPQSLDLAIQTLIDLQQGGRTIGIISHVTELKEQMPLRIDVIPGRSGSQLSITSRSS